MNFATHAYLQALHAAYVVTTIAANPPSHYWESAASRWRHEVALLQAPHFRSLEPADGKARKRAREPATRDALANV